MQSPIDLLTIDLQFPLSAFWPLNREKFACHLMISLYFAQTILIRDFHAYNNKSQVC